MIRLIRCAFALGVPPSILICLKETASVFFRFAGMATILYRCPNMGLQVQGWFADDGSETGGETYQTVTCMACRQLHLVNPKTGKTLGVDED